jgi:redox-sensitive bicupin YhaK (pirin superfamily)
VAQPESTRHRPAAFEHHAELPKVDVPGAEVTVLVGEVAGERSPARADTPLVGTEVVLASGTATVPLHPAYEHAAVGLDGAVTIGGQRVGTGVLAYLGEGRDEIDVGADGPARLMLLGGEPFPDPIVMSWTFVARTRGEADEAARQWNAGDARFGSVASSLARIPAPGPGPG